MHAFLQTRISVPSLATFCITLGVLWARSLYLAARHGKDEDIGLFWVGLLFFGPFIGLTFSFIVFMQYRTGAYRGKPWVIAGIVGGLSPLLGWIMLWLFA
jgi:hypothetical protein